MIRTAEHTALTTRALKAVGRYEDLRCAVTEYDVAWSDGLLNELDVETLLTRSAERLAEQLVGQTTREPAGS